MFQARGREISNNLKWEKIKSRPVCLKDSETRNEVKGQMI